MFFQLTNHKYNGFKILTPHIRKVETPNTVLPTGKMSQMF